MQDSAAPSCRRTSLTRSRWIRALFQDSREEAPGLAQVYLVRILCLVVLWFPCRWFAELERGRRDWWPGCL